MHFSLEWFSHLVAWSLCSCFLLFHSLLIAKLFSSVVLFYDLPHRFDFAYFPFVFLFISLFCSSTDHWWFLIHIRYIVCSCCCFLNVLTKCAPYFLFVCCFTIIVVLLLLSLFLSLSLSNSAIYASHNLLSMRFFSLSNFSFFLSCSFLSRPACFFVDGPSSSLASLAAAPHLAG